MTFSSVPALMGIALTSHRKPLMASTDQAWMGMISGDLQANADECPNSRLRSEDEQGRRDNEEKKFFIGRSI